MRSHRRLEKAECRESDRVVESRLRGGKATLAGCVRCGKDRLGKVLA